MGTTTVEILNAIRNAASTEYTSRVPLATRNNIAMVGNAILNYVPALNEFTGTLIDKIGMTVISNKLAKNPLAPFKRGLMPYGATIEEIFVEMAAAESAAVPTGTNPLGRRVPDVKVMYHSENRQDIYAKSITKAQLHKAFQSADGLETLLANIVTSMYSGSTHDEFVIMKRILADYQLNYADYEVSTITNESTARQFVKTLRKAVMDLKFMSTDYNKAGVMTQTEVQDQVLIINKDVIAHVDVDVLAKAFNMGKTDFEPSIIVVDNFADMENTYAVLCDKDFLFVYDTSVEMTEQFNAQGRFTNYFLHIDQILSTSQFKNAIRFVVVPEPAIAALTVTSVDGTNLGDTKITVAPALTAGNTYVYKTAAAVVLPSYDDVCDAGSGWTAWNGVADITATTADEIAITEIDNDSLAKKTGKDTVDSKDA